MQKNSNSSVLLPPSRTHVIQPSQTPTGFQGGSLFSNPVFNLNGTALLLFASELYNKKLYCDLQMHFKKYTTLVLMTDFKYLNRYLPLALR